MRQRCRVSCVTRDFQLRLAYIWARPAILAAGKGRGGVFLFLAHLLGCAIVMALFPVCIVHHPQFASNDISSTTTGGISTKVDRIVPLEVL